MKLGLYLCLQWRINHHHRRFLTRWKIASENFSRITGRQRRLAEKLGKKRGIAFEMEMDDDGGRNEVDLPENNRRPVGTSWRKDKWDSHVLRRGRFPLGFHDYERRLTYVLSRHGRKREFRRHAIFPGELKRDRVSLAVRGQPCQDAIRPGHFDESRDNHRRYKRANSRRTFGRRTGCISTVHQ